MFEIIIVPLDGSELAESALDVAKALQEKFASRLILVRAIEPKSHRLAQVPVFFESPAAAAANIEIIQKITSERREEARAYLSAIAARLQSEAVETLVAEDSPADAIVALAKERGAALIVMSSHGRGGLGRLVFGSVADLILHASPVPVLLVKHSVRSSP